jgi:hypothetical protein
VRHCGINFLPISSVGLSVDCSPSKGSTDCSVGSSPSCQKERPPAGWLMDGAKNGGLNKISGVGQYRTRLHVSPMKGSSEPLARPPITRWPTGRTRVHILVTPHPPPTHESAARKIRV